MAEAALTPRHNTADYGSDPEKSQAKAARQCLPSSWSVGASRLDFTEMLPEGTCRGYWNQ